MSFSSQIHSIYWYFFPHRLLVNPLRSGKKKHKMLALYLTLADILPQNRSSTAACNTLIFVKNRISNIFVKIIHGPFCQRLKIFEASGMDLPDKSVCKRKLVCHSN